MGPMFPGILRCQDVSPESALQDVCPVFLRFEFSVCPRLERRDCHGSKLQMALFVGIGRHSQKPSFLLRVGRVVMSRTLCKHAGFHLGKERRELKPSAHAIITSVPSFKQCRVGENR